MWLAACAGQRPTTSRVATEQPRAQSPRLTKEASPPSPSPSLRLRVGTSGDYAPFSHDGHGFDIDVAAALAQSLGAELEWVSFRWPELTDAARRGDFDVAMSGVTWRPARAIEGRLSRAVAAGGPCLLSTTTRHPPGRVAVNRGGILEAYARRSLRFSAIRAVDDNTALPQLLLAAEVDAIVTDSFELAHFRRPGWHERCEPRRDRKVYWITRVAPAGLAERIDAWIGSQEPLLARLRQRHFGEAAPRSDLQHLVDLLSRRLELMPAVAATKRARGLPVEDPRREQAVLASMRARAAERGVQLPGLDRLFVTQMELAKAVQRRVMLRAPTASAGVAAPASKAATPLEPVSAAAPQPLDLDQLRATLLVLGDRILDALLPAPGWASIETEDLGLLAPLLRPEELLQLRDALRGVQQGATAAARATAGMPK